MEVRDKIHRHLKAGTQTLPPEARCHGGCTLSIRVLAIRDRGWYYKNLVTFSQLDSPGSRPLNNLCDAQVLQSIRAHNACPDEQPRLLPLPAPLLLESFTK